jgi:lactosylceramide 4-alpha-galactosyltransferase
VSNRSLDALGTNYVGVDPPDHVGSSVLNFGWDGVGHAVADMCVEELRTNFRGDIWIHNGPGLITRVLLEKCNCSSVSYRAGRAAWLLATVIQLHNVITQCAVQ